MRKPKSPHGTVTVQVYKARIRLVWTCPVNRKRIYLALSLPDSAINRNAAQQKALFIQNDMGSGNYDPTLKKYKSESQIERDRLTIVDLFQQFMDYKAKGVTPKTLEKYKATLKYIERFFEDLKADQVGESQAEGFGAYLAKCDLSKDQCKRRLEELKACWTWAIERKLLKDNNPWIEPYRRVKVPPQQMPKPFSSEEIGAIVQAFRSDRAYCCYADFVEFLFATGCRTGEAIGLQWKHLNDNCSGVWIGEILTRGKRRPVKSNKARSFGLTENLQKLLLARRPVDVDPEALVFTGPTGKCIDDGNFRNRAWKTVLTRLEVDYRHPYNTRSTLVSHALELGMSPVSIAQLTGHDVKVLYDRYAGAIASSPQLPTVF
jgi:integrase